MCKSIFKVDLQNFASCFKVIIFLLLGGSTMMYGHLKRYHQITGIETIPRSNDPERMRCPHCSKLFKKHNSLKDHINTHTGARPHICKHCGKTFASQGNMHAHIRTAHMGLKRNYDNRKSNTNIKLEMIHSGH